MTNPNPILPQTYPQPNPTNSNSNPAPTQLHPNPVVSRQLLVSKPALQSYQWMGGWLGGGGGGVLRL